MKENEKTKRQKASVILGKLRDKVDKAYAEGGLTYEEHNVAVALIVAGNGYLQGSKEVVKIEFEKMIHG